MMIWYLEESTPVMLRSLQKFAPAPVMGLDGESYGEIFSIDKNNLVLI